MGGSKTKSVVNKTLNCDGFLGLGPKGKLCHAKSLKKFQVKNNSVELWNEKKTEKMQEIIGKVKDDKGGSWVSPFNACVFS